MATDFNNSGSSSDSPANAPVYTSHFGGLGDHRSSHPAIILKRTFMDGNIKVFVDSTGGAEKTEILVPEGKVVVYKDFEITPEMSRYKKIDILTIEDELHGTMDLIVRDRTNPRPVYRVFFERGELGSANGDIGMLIAHKLLGGNIDTSAAIGSSIDDEVIDTLKRVLHSKR